MHSLQAINSNSQASINLSKRFFVIRVAFVALSATALTSCAISNGCITLCIKSEAVPLRLIYFQDQIERLQHIPATCFARFVGNAVGPDGIYALDIPDALHPKCFGETDMSTTAVSTHSKIISLTTFGYNLIRVDQNYGGTFTLVRYVIVSVVHPKPTLGAKTDEIIVRRAILPSDITNEAAATIEAEKLAKSMARDL